MKQLILYFLFFICAAFILVQCARLFPTDNKAPRHQSVSQKRNSSLENKKSTVRAPQPGVLFDYAGSKQMPFNLYFSGHAFPLTMMNYFNQYQFLTYRYWSLSSKKNKAPQLLFNSYTGLTHDGFLSRSDTGLIANNPFDQNK